jgi:hypothetical protein
VQHAAHAASERVVDHLVLLDAGFALERIGYNLARISVSISWAFIGMADVLGWKISALMYANHRVECQCDAAE